MSSVNLNRYKNKLTYKEYSPLTALADFVNCYWWFENNACEKLDFTILPDGAFDLIIHFDHRVLSTTSLTGICTKKSDVSIGAGQQLFGVRFKLLAADYIFKQPLAEYLDDAWRLDNNFLEIDQVGFPDLGKLINHFNERLHAELDKHNPVDMRKKKLFDLLNQTKGQLQINEYAENVSWSSRQINRYFNKWFGVPLKTYCSILKVHSSLSHIREGQLFPEENFYDQSHFIKSVKRYTGATPESLQQNRNDRFLQLLPDSDD